jgi:NADH-quinone oxidoreductase subunit G
MVRDGGSLREVPWERALSEAAAALARSGERTTAVVGGRATNEEGFLVQHLLRQGLGSPHVSAGSELALARSLARTDLAAKVSDIDHAGAILVVDVEPVEEAPILDLRIRKAVRRNHASLVVASSRPSTLDPNADAALRFAPGSTEAALAALAAALGSPRTAELTLDGLAQKAGATRGFIPGRRAAAATNGDSGEDAPGAVRAAADVLRNAGDVVIVWGERAASGARGAQTAEALLALAGVLGLAERPESGLIGIPVGTNGRGLREVGCSPELGPGLSDAPAAGDPAGAGGAVLLVETEVPEDVMARAPAVIAFAGFPSEALDQHASVVFPAETYAEKEGTITHPDGRIQRVRQALGHANEVRPGWQVLADLCERAGAGTGALTAPMVTALVAEAVPIYAGLTLEEIGGLGVRWQERAAASALPEEPPSDRPLEVPPSAPRGLRLAAAPTLWSGSEIEHSPSLRFLAAQPRAELSLEDARRLGVENGGEVSLAVNGDRVTATAAVRTGVPAGSVFLSGARMAEGAVEVTARGAVAR